MELRRRRFNFRKVFTILYIAAFLTYLIIGLQPAKAISYEFSGGLAIPSIDLITPVTSLELKDHRLNTPDTIAGSYSRYSSKTFLVGHSTTVFKSLFYVNKGDLIYYNDKIYQINKIETLAKADIDMGGLIAPEKENTLVIMTCAGEPVSETDATHRLIVTASEV